MLDPLSDDQSNEEIAATLFFRQDVQDHVYAVLGKRRASTRERADKVRSSWA